MRLLLTRHTTAGPIHVVATDAADGDLAPAAPGVAARRRLVVDRPWVWLDQVHGARVIDVDASGEGRCVTGAGPRADRDPQVHRADAAWTSRGDVALSVVTADCVGIALASADGAFGVAHAGWRGLLAGVVEATVARLTDAGHRSLQAAVGPCIGPEHYEFGAAERAPLVERYGPTLEGRTAGGAGALDLRAGVLSALDGVGVPVMAVDDRRSTDAGCWSHRLRADRQRQAVVVWRDGPAR